MLASLDPGAGEYYGAELLKKNAGLLVRRPGAAGGGVAGMQAARLAARRIEANLASALRCLLSAQALRMVMVVLLLVLRLPEVSPLQLLFGGLILDFGAILVCAFDRGEDCATDAHFFDRPLRACLPYLTLGALCGAGTVLIGWLLCRTEILIDQHAVSGFLFISMTLTQIVLLFACRRGAKRFGRSLIGWLWPLGELVFAVLCFAIPAIGDVFSVAPLPTAAWICLPVSPLIAFFGGEILYTASRLRTAWPSAVPEEDADGET